MRPSVLAEATIAPCEIARLRFTLRTQADTSSQMLVRIRTQDVLPASRDHTKCSKESQETRLSCANNPQTSAVWFDNVLAFWRTPVSLAPDSSLDSCFRSWCDSLRCADIDSRCSDGVRQYASRLGIGLEAEVLKSAQRRHDSERR